MNENNITIDDNFVFPTDLSTEHDATPEKIAEFLESQPKQGLEILEDKKPKETEEDDDNTIIDEETGEVTTITKSEPAITPASDGIGYRAIVITMTDDEAETRAEIEHRALSNPELAEALTKGKKTWDGFFRFWHNKTREAHKAFNYGQSALVVKREQVWDLAEEYFLNDNLRDTQVPASKPKKQPKPKAEKKPAKAKTIPLTPQMGDMFADFFNDDNND